MFSQFINRDNMAFVRLRIQFNDVFIKELSTKYIEILKSTELYYRKLEPSINNTIPESHLEVWLCRVIKLVFDDDTTVHAAAVEALSSFLPHLMKTHYSKYNFWGKTKAILMNDFPSQLEEKYESHDYWSNIWCMAITILDRDLLDNKVCMNKYLAVVQYAFRSQELIKRDNGFVCWRVLIDLFVKHNDLTKKRMKLIFIPLKSIRAKAVPIAEHKFLIFWTLLRVLRRNSDDESFHETFELFFRYCFNIDENKTSREITTAEDNRYFWELHRVFPSVLVYLLLGLTGMLGEQNQETQAIAQQLKFVITEQHTINADTFAKFHRTLINACYDATVFSSQAQNLDSFKLCKNMWDNLINHIETCEDDKIFNFVMEIIRDLSNCKLPHFNIKNEIIYEILFRLSTIKYKKKPNSLDIIHPKLMQILICFFEIDIIFPAYRSLITECLRFDSILNDISSWEEYRHFLNTVLFINDNVNFKYKLEIWSKCCSLTVDLLNKKLNCHVEVMNAVISLLLMYPIAKIHQFTLQDVLTTWRALFSKYETHLGCNEAYNFISEVIREHLVSSRNKELYSIMFICFKLFNFIQFNFTENFIPNLSLVKYVLSSFADSKEKNPRLIKAINIFSDILLDTMKKISIDSFIKIIEDMNEIFELFLPRAPNDKIKKIDSVVSDRFTKNQIENCLKKESKKVQKLFVSSMRHFDSPKIKTFIKRFEPKPIDDSNDFVVIENTPTYLNAEVLTEHQKEKLKEKRFIPALYNDMSQSQDSSTMKQFKKVETIEPKKTPTEKRQTNSTATTAAEEQPCEKEITVHETTTEGKENITLNKKEKRMKNLLSVSSNTNSSKTNAENDNTGKPSETLSKHKRQREIKKLAIDMVEGKSFETVPLARTRRSTSISAKELKVSTIKKVATKKNQKLQVKNSPPKKRTSSTQKPETNKLPETTTEDVPEAPSVEKTPAENSNTIPSITENRAPILLKIVTNRRATLVSLENAPPVNFSIISDIPSTKQGSSSMMTTTASTTVASTIAASTTVASTTAASTTAASTTAASTTATSTTATSTTAASTTVASSITISTTAITPSTTTTAATSTVPAVTEIATAITTTPKTSSPIATPKVLIPTSESSPKENFNIILKKSPRKALNFDESNDKSRLEGMVWLPISQIRSDKGDNKDEVIESSQSILTTKATQKIRCRNLEELKSKPTVIVENNVKKSVADDEIMSRYSNILSPHKPVVVLTKMDSYLMNRISEMDTEPNNFNDLNQSTGVPITVDENVMLNSKDIPSSPIIAAPGNSSMNKSGILSSPEPSNLEALNTELMNDTLDLSPIPNGDQKTENDVSVIDSAALPQVQAIKMSDSKDTNNISPKQRLPNTLNVVNSFSPTTTSRSSRMVSMILAGQQNSPKTEITTPKAVKENKLLTFSRILPSPCDPSGRSILKRKLHNDDTLVDDFDVQAAKRKRVSFNDPPVTCEKTFEIEIDETPNSGGPNKFIDELRLKKKLALRRNGRINSISEMVEFTSTPTKINNVHEVIEIDDDDVEEVTAVEMSLLEVSNSIVENMLTQKSLNEKDEATINAVPSSTSSPTKITNNVDPDSSSKFKFDNEEQMLEYVLQQCLGRVKRVPDASADLEKRLLQALVEQYPNESVKCLTQQYVVNSSYTSTQNDYQLLETMIEKYPTESIKYALQENSVKNVCKQLSINSLIDYVFDYASKLNANAANTSGLANKDYDNIRDELTKKFDVLLKNESLDKQISALTKKQLHKLDKDKMHEFIKYISGDVSNKDICSYIYSKLLPELMKDAEF